ncbi:zinc ribbon domain-containing protein [bacterium]|nr:zinc ribbon domain-containing protein [bacterium]
MPIYTFFCEKCKKKYELVCRIKDYNDAAPCEYCKSNKHIYRLYIDDVATQSASVKKSDSELKTIGDLALRNTDRMSDDEKEHLKRKHNDYKEKPTNKQLPKGMSRVNRPKIKTKWV